MSDKQATIQQIHLICASASVSLPTVRKYLAGKEPLRPAMIERIEESLRKLELSALLQKKALRA